MAQNPVINKFGSQWGGNEPQTPTPVELQNMYDQPAYKPPRPAIGRYMTLDDVVVRTGAMLGMVLAAGAVAWIAVPDHAIAPVIIVAAMAGLGLGLYMSFTMRVNAALALVYAAAEGVLLGTISRAFNERWPGIVVQAMIGTAVVAAGMLVVYKVGAIRVTPRFTRIVVGATIGVFGLMIVNLIAYLVHPGGLGLRDGGPIAILFSLLCIVVAAMNLVMDFDVVERGIREGADVKFAWYAAFGLTVTLVWLYLEILRLLSYFYGGRR